MENGVDMKPRDTGDAGAFVPPAAPLVEPNLSGFLPPGRIVGACEARLFGMSAEERQRRAMARAGVTDIARWDSSAALPAERVLLLCADWILDGVLVLDLAAGEPRVLVTEDGSPVAATVDAADAAATVAALTGTGALPAHLPRVTAAQLSTAYRGKLRKREVPYALHLTPQTARAVEARMFVGSYKGVTDIVTKYCWPPLALPATRWCAERGISPNAVTWASLVLVLLAMACFWHGLFLPGLLCAWGMTFLDTVDGKLARCTLSYSKLGDVFDHGIDLVHPPFWYWAWAVGLAAVGMLPPHLGLLLAVIIGGYVAQRVEEGLFIALFKIEMHVWRRFDSRFRLITARRNPNLLLLTAAALVGRPDLGLVWVAWWTGLCFLVHAGQIVQAWLVRRKGGEIRSWLAAAP